MAELVELAAAALPAAEARDDPTRVVVYLAGAAASAVVGGAAAALDLATTTRLLPVLARTAAVAVRAPPALDAAAVLQVLVLPPLLHAVAGVRGVTPAGHWRPFWAAVAYDVRTALGAAALTPAAAAAAVAVLAAVAVHSPMDILLASATSVRRLVLPLLGLAIEQPELADAVHNALAHRTHGGGVCQIVSAMQTACPHDRYALDAWCAPRQWRVRPRRVGPRRRSCRWSARSWCRRTASPRAAARVAAARPRRRGPASSRISWHASRGMHTACRQHGTRPEAYPADSARSWLAYRDASGDSAAAARRVLRHLVLPWLQLWLLQRADAVADPITAVLLTAMANRTCACNRDGHAQTSR